MKNILKLLGNWSEKIKYKLKKRIRDDIASMKAGKVVTSLSVFSILVLVFTMTFSSIAIFASNGDNVVVNGKQFTRYFETGSDSKNHGYIEFGAFPQTEVTDQSLINVLSTKTANSKTGKIEYEGNEYVKERKDDSSDYHYYLVEPILWRVIDYDTTTHKAILWSDMVLESRIFNSHNKATVKWSTIDPKSINTAQPVPLIRTYLNSYNLYPNTLDLATPATDYSTFDTSTKKTSAYTDYLYYEMPDGTDFYDRGFFDKAFTDSEQGLIVPDTFKNYNKDYDGIFIDSSYARDKVRLLTYSDLKKSVYGFNTNDSLEDVNRRGHATAYAELKYSKTPSSTYASETTPPSNTIVYSELSVNTSVTGNIVTVDERGYYIWSNSVSSLLGIRPEITIDLDRITNFAGDGSKENPYKMKNRNAKFENTFTTYYENGTDNKNHGFIYLGKYPRKKETSTTIKTALGSLSADSDTGIITHPIYGEYVLYNSNYYRLEPIKWMILDINASTNEAIIMTEEVIDGTKWNTVGTDSTNKKWDGTNGASQANTGDYPFIRVFLNSYGMKDGAKYDGSGTSTPASDLTFTHYGNSDYQKRGFLDKAFTDLERATIVKTAPKTFNKTYDGYSIANTKDYVRLLSNYEMTSYGFGTASTVNGRDSNRLGFLNDYSDDKITDSKYKDKTTRPVPSYCIYSEQRNTVNWKTMSLSGSSSASSHTAYIVLSSGVSGENSTSYGGAQSSITGIRPVMTIDLSALQGLSGDGSFINPYYLPEGYQMPFLSSLTPWKYDNQGAASYINFGSFPKSDVTAELGTVLSGLSENPETGKIEYNGEEYVKETNGSNTKYFKVEPITWQILQVDKVNKKILLTTESCIESRTWDFQNETTIKWDSSYKTSGGTLDKGDYTPMIRCYLNNYEIGSKTYGMAYALANKNLKTTYKYASSPNGTDFYNRGFIEKAFSKDERRLLLDQSIQNGTTGLDGKWISNSVDKVRLLTSGDIKVFGFHPTATTKDATSGRLGYTTPYSLFRYTNSTATYSPKTTQDWWLLSSKNATGAQALYVKNDGAYSQDSYGQSEWNSYLGIRPVISLNAVPIESVEGEGTIDNPYTIGSDTKIKTNGEFTLWNQLGSDGFNHGYIYFGKYAQDSFFIQEWAEIAPTDIDPDTGTVFRDFDEDGKMEEYVSNDASWYPDIYKVEPIKWRILEDKDDKLVLMSDMILDTKKYDIQTGYNYNWQGSSGTYPMIRCFLNSYKISGSYNKTSGTAASTLEISNSAQNTNYEDRGFYEKAFSELEKLILVKDTSRYYAGGNEVSSDTSEDFVRLPSIGELTNSEMGFPASTVTDALKSNRLAYDTAYSSRSSKGDSYGGPKIKDYWLKYRKSNSNGNVLYFNSNGPTFEFATNFSADSLKGIRPVITIDKNLLPETMSGLGTFDEPYYIPDSYDIPISKRLKTWDGKDDTACHIAWGRFPKTDVTAELGTVLSGLTEDPETGKIEYNGEEYVKESNDSDVKYFKVEPIVWDVLTYDEEKGEALLISDTILESRVWNSGDSLEIKWDTTNGSTTAKTEYYPLIRTYLNNYELTNNKYLTTGTEVAAGDYSTFDGSTDPKAMTLENYKTSPSGTSFYNRGFLEKAFSQDERAYLVKSNIKNYDTDYYDDGKSNLENCYDYVRLLTKTEANLASYGFTTDKYGTGSDTNRLGYTTDYSLFKSDISYKSTSYGVGGATTQNYWLTTNNDKDYTYTISSSGRNNDNVDLGKCLGVRPVITLNLNNLSLKGSGTKNDPFKAPSTWKVNKNAGFNKYFEKGQDGLSRSWVEFGSYPQYEVGQYNYPALFEVLNTMTAPEGESVELDPSTGKIIYTHDGKIEEFVKIEGSPSYFMRVDPIKWKVLKVSGNKVVLLSDALLEERKWNSGTSKTLWSGTSISSTLSYPLIRLFLNSYELTGTDVTSYNASSGIPLSNLKYKASSVGTSFAERGFYEKAFNDIEKEIILSDSHLAEDMDASGDGDQTPDKVRIPTEKMITSTSYGFPDGNTSFMASNRYTFLTSYAMRNVGNSEYALNNETGWISRDWMTVTSYNNSYPRIAQESNGQVSGGSGIRYGVRPEITIDASALKNLDGLGTYTDPYKLPADYELPTSLKIDVYFNKDANGKSRGYIEYGHFPKTEITDTKLINVLSGLAVSPQTGLITYDGEQYVKEEKTVGGGEWHYFLVEPIKWQVLSYDRSTSEALLLSESVLESRNYDTQSYYEVRWPGYTNNGTPYGYPLIRLYLNNYKILNPGTVTSYSFVDLNNRPIATSDLSKDFNEPDNTPYYSRGFLGKAFTSTERANLKTTTPTSVNATYEVSAEPDTVRLLTYSEVSNANFGFTTTAQPASSILLSTNRAGWRTDYSMLKLKSSSTNSTYEGFDTVQRYPQIWMLEGRYSGLNITSVDYNGKKQTTTNANNPWGVRPVISLDVSDINFIGGNGDIDTPFSPYETKYNLTITSNDLIGTVIKKYPAGDDRVLTLDLTPGNTIKGIYTDSTKTHKKSTDEHPTWFQMPNMDYSVYVDVEITQEAALYVANNSDKETIVEMLKSPDYVDVINEGTGSDISGVLDLSDEELSNIADLIQTNKELSEYENIDTLKADISSMLGPLYEDTANGRKYYANKVTDLDGNEIAGYLNEGGIITYNFKDSSNADIPELKAIFYYLEGDPGSGLIIFDGEGNNKNPNSFYSIYEDVVTDLTKYTKVVCSEKGFKPSNLDNILTDLSNLVSVDFTNLNDENLTSMVRTFYDTTSLLSLDLSSVDTSKVTSFDHCFCLSGLTNINLGGEFSTEACIDFSSMFSLCESLTSLDLSNFNTAKAKSFDGMFTGCENINNLNISNFDFSNVINMRNMFDGCKTLKTITFPEGMSAPKCFDYHMMFYNCLALESLNLQDLVGQEAIYLDGMFYNCAKIQNVNILNWDTSNVQYFEQLFLGCKKLTTITGIEDLDTSSAKSFYEMFKNCVQLESLDLSSWDTSNVQSFTNMFEYCNSLEILKLFGTENFGTYQDEIVTYDDSTYDVIYDGKFNESGAKDNSISYTVNASSKTKTISGADNLYVDFLYDARTTLKLISDYNEHPSEQVQSSIYVFDKNTEAIYANKNQAILNIKSSTFVNSNSLLNRVKYYIPGDTVNLLYKRSSSSYGNGYFAKIYKATGKTEVEKTKYNFSIMPHAEVYDMFTGCSTLEELHLPKTKSFGTEIALPKTMYDADGNAWSEIGELNSDDEIVLTLTKPKGAFVKDINDSEDDYEVYNILKDNKEVLEISDFDDLSNLNKVIVSNYIFKNKPYDSYDDFKDAYDLVVSKTKSSYSSSLSSNKNPVMKGFNTTLTRTIDADSLISSLYTINDIYKQPNSTGSLNRTKLNQNNLNGSYTITGASSSDEGYYVMTSTLDTSIPTSVASTMLTSNIYKQNVSDVNFSSFHVVLDNASYEYNGNPKCPVVTLYDSSSPDAEEINPDLYEYSYLNNTEVGTAQVVITGKGAFAGSTYSPNPTFEITAIPQIGAYARSVPDYTYNGTEQLPEVVVYDFMGSPLDPSMYEIVYADGSDKTNAGTVHFSINFVGHYSGQINNLSYKIKPKDLTINLKDSAYKETLKDEKTYDNTKALTGDKTVKVATGVSSEEITIVLEGEFASKNATLSGTFDEDINFKIKSLGCTSNLSNYNITWTWFANADPYAASEVITMTDYGKINKKEITYNVTVDKKTYDGNALVPDSNIHMSNVQGIIEGDDVSFNLTGSYDSKDAGSDRTITLTPSLTGASRANYEVSGKTLTNSVIDHKEITYSVVVENKKFDNSNDARSVTTVAYLSGKVEGEDVDVELGSATFDGSSYGDHTVTVTVKLKGNADVIKNYFIRNQATTHNARITKETIDLTFTVASKVYDGNTDASSCVSINTVKTSDGTDVKASVPVKITQATFDDENVKAGKTITIIPEFENTSDKENFEFVTSSFEVTNGEITAKPLTANAVVASKVYDATTNITPNDITVTSSDIVSGDDVTFAKSGSYTSKTVGTGKEINLTISLSGSDANNYSLQNPSQTISTGEITARKLEYTLNIPNKEYDGNKTITGATATVTSGIQGGDNVSLKVTLAKFKTPDLGDNKEVDVTLELEGTDKGNYTFDASTNAKANITLKIVKLEFSASTSKVYDKATNAKDLVTISKITDKDGTALTDVPVEIDSATFDNFNVGTGKTITVIPKFTNEQDRLNYSFEKNTYELNDGQITPKSLTYDISVNEKTYDGTKSATAVAVRNSFAGLVTGDNPTITLSNGEFASKDASDAVTATFDAAIDNSNYSISPTISGTGKIKKKDLHIDATTDDGEYNIGDPIAVKFTLRTEDLVGSESVGLSTNAGTGIVEESPNKKVKKVNVDSWPSITGSASVTKNYNEVHSDCFVNLTRIDLTNERLEITIVTRDYYDGTPKDVQVTVKFPELGVTLREGTDFSFEYLDDHTELGTHDIKITFIGEYKGERNSSFEIKEKPQPAPSGGGGGGSSSGGVTYTILPKDDAPMHYAFMNGYKDKTFRPQESITREEVATIVARLDSEFNEDFNFTSFNTFSDANDKWSKNYIGFCKLKDLIHGYKDGTFRPSNMMTRAELATLVNNFLRVQNADFDKVDLTKPAFSDVDGRWYEESVNKLAALGILNGYEDGTFKGDKPVTRIEVAIVMNKINHRQAFDEIPDEYIEKISSAFKDITPDRWFFKDVAESVVDHPADLY